MRIPVTMCHGLQGPPRTLDADRFVRYFSLARQLGFESISYDTLAAARAGQARLPAHPILFDFDHPVRNICSDIRPILADLGYTGNLFVHTQPLADMYAAGPLAPAAERWLASWDELAELKAAGWTIGAHTHTHPDLSALAEQDPTGAKIRDELDTNDSLLRRHLGVEPLAFAFTGNTYSRLAEEEVRRRYRFGRLWIIGASYRANGADIRFADLVGLPGPDLPDGGPPAAARYLTESTDPYRIPSMELSALIWDFDAYRSYLEGAL